MDEPAEDIAHQPVDLLTAMRMGVDYTFNIKVRTLEIKVRPLSVVERINVVNEAREQISKEPPHRQTELAYLSLVCMKTLEQATTPEPHSKVRPRLSVAILERMTNDELTALYNEYRDGCDRVDPAIETLSDAKLAELVQAAKKNGYDWTALPRPHLEQLARFLLTPAASPADSTPGGSFTQSHEATLP